MGFPVPRRCTVANHVQDEKFPESNVTSRGLMSFILAQPSAIPQFMTVTLPAVNERHRLQLDALDLPERLLLGPGPSNAHPLVLKALNTQPIGHLDPKFLELMNEIQELLRYSWQTDNRLTIPVSGTGSAAMEATLANTVEPADIVLVAVNGYFGHRLVDMAGRYQADVRTLHRHWGEVFTLSELEAAIQTHRPQILALVHAETSTGARQPLEGIGDLCRKYGCLLLVDSVTSLGAVPLFLDDWGVDLAYSCSQKGLSCPPGVSPFTMGPRAEEKVARRTHKVANWYLDMSLLSQYWGSNRVYHHTAPVNMNFGMRESLRLIADEGIENCWQRHQETAELLWAGLEDLGLNCHVPKENRLPTLTTVRIPEGVDGKQVQAQLLADYGIEIGGGLGELAGQVWRIGLMGYNSRKENALRLLDALRDILNQ
jgi:alanine-glyoxylate transaminase/serine-glyoxylate transaminase/serine-pyruvate transaminase